MPKLLLTLNVMPVQSVPITNKVVSSNRVHGEMYSIQHYVIKICQWLATGQWFSQGTPVFSTNKTDRHNITEILLYKVIYLKELLIWLYHHWLNFHLI